MAESLADMLRWLLKEAWEKINIRATYQSIKTLGKKHGKRFFWAAIIWECIEDIVFPFLSWRMGMPELIPVFLVLHFEPIVYPAFFWGFRTWDRYQGREPWEPDRGAQSSHWRSVVKVTVYQLTVMGWLSHVIGWKPLVIQAALTSLFGFIHERIWHDANYGIRADDTVQVRRTFGKTGTYLLISTITLGSLLRVYKIPHLWVTLGIAQGIAGILYIVLETVWASSKWGVQSTHSSET